MKYYCCNACAFGLCRMALDTVSGDCKSCICLLQYCCIWSIGNIFLVYRSSFWCESCGYAYDEKNPFRFWYHVGAFGICVSFEWSYEVYLYFWFNQSFGNSFDNTFTYRGFDYRKDQRKKTIQENSDYRSVTTLWYLADVA